MEIEVELTANHKGRFQFKVCPVGRGEEATQVDKGWTVRVNKSQTRFFDYLYDFSLRQYHCHCVMVGVPGPAPANQAGRRADGVPGVRDPAPGAADPAGPPAARPHLQPLRPPVDLVRTALQ